MEFNSADTLDNLPVTSSHQKAKPQIGDKVSKQELWELQYNHQPYLRQLSDEQVFRFGFIAVDAMKQHFLIGGTKLPASELESWMSKWSHFLCEARFRGLDMRQMPKA